VCDRFARGRRLQPDSRGGVFSIAKYTSDLLDLEEVVPSRRPVGGSHYPRRPSRSAADGELIFALEALAARVGRVPRRGLLVEERGDVAPIADGNSVNVRPARLGAKRGLGVGALVVDLRASGT